MSDEENVEETPKKSGGGLLSTIPLAVIAAAATFGIVWLAASPAPPVTEDACSVFVEESKKVVPPEELEARAARYVTLEPITVSLSPDAGAQHLRISLALGTPPDGEELTDVQFLRLRDRFIERLRTVDTALIADPKAMPDLKQSLLVQARTTLGEDAVYSVLVTDFLMK